MSSWRAACQIWYQDMLAEVNLKKPRNLRKVLKGNIVECVCGADENDNKPKVCCSKCGRWQHAECVGFKRQEGESDSKSYCCPHCWQVKVITLHTVSTYFIFIFLLLIQIRYFCLFPSLIPFSCLWSIYFTFVFSAGSIEMT